MSQPAHSSSEPPVPGSHYQPALGVVLIIVVLFIGSTFLILRTTGPVNPKASVTTLATTTTARSGTTTTPRAKSRVRVQVANGTLVSNLARTYTQQLTTLGWLTLPPLNAARVSATIVYYNPGFAWAAQEVAGDLKASSSAIRPLGGLLPVPGAAGDDVIVLLGPDLAING